MNCGQAAQVHAYHDGELNAANRVAIESHLENCASCRTLLEELRGTSRWIASAELPRMPSDLPARILAEARHRHEIEESAMRRLAGWMTAVAAAVLLVALLGSPFGQHSQQIETA